MEYAGEMFFVCAGSGIGAGLTAKADCEVSGVV